MKTRKQTQRISNIAIAIEVNLMSTKFEIFLNMQIDIQFIR